MTEPSASGAETIQQFRAKVCRDSRGRTRYENIGNPASGCTPDFIHDPLTGTMYVLFPSGQIDRRFVQFIPSELDRRTVIASAARPTQDLGTKVIEGFQVTGVRRKIGLIGAPGGLPYGGTEEEWYSPALRVVIMRANKYSPSYKEVYRLTHIVREAPSAELFKVPAG